MSVEEPVGGRQRTAASETATMSPMPAIPVAGLSHVGLKRSTNQDRWIAFGSRWGECLLVADGMGGHKGGERAAEMVADSIPRYLRDMPAETALSDAVRMAVERTNSDVFREGHGDNPEVQGMGSTVVLAVLSGDELVVAHCGDSRAYLFGSHGLRRLTEDHTVGNKMLRAGILSEDQALHHPDSGLLTRSVGVAEEIQVTISSPIRLSPGDTVLLCSDGLSRHVPERGIGSALSARSSPQAIAGALVNLALKKGGSDNVTVLVTRSGTSPASSWASLSTALRRVRWISVGVAALALILIVSGIRYLGLGKGHPPAQTVTVASPAAPSAPSPVQRTQPTPDPTGPPASTTQRAGTRLPIARPGPPDPKPEGLIVVQILADQKQFKPRVWGLVNYWSNSPKTFQVLFLKHANPGAFLAAIGRTSGVVTIFYDPAICSKNFCSPENLIRLRDSIKMVSGEIPGAKVFHPSPKQVKEMVAESASNLEKSGVLIVLRP